MYIRIYTYTYIIYSVFLCFTYPIFSAPLGEPIQVLHGRTEARLLLPPVFTCFTSKKFVFWMFI